MNDLDDSMSKLLQQIEANFAPAVEELPAVFSPQETERKGATNSGGDKMRGHDYAPFYAKLFKDFSPNVIVELGIFRGVSLAMWERLWPGAFLIGLDLEFSRFHSNLHLLRERGAKLNNLALVEWDAYSNQPPAGLRPFDLFVDDGPHTDSAILGTIEVMRPFINTGARYVVEDNSRAGRLLQKSFPSAYVVSSGSIAAAIFV